MIRCKEFLTHNSIQYLLKEVLVIICRLFEKGFILLLVFNRERYVAFIVKGVYSTGVLKNGTPLQLMSRT